MFDFYKHCFLSILETIFVFTDIRVSATQEFTTIKVKKSTARQDEKTVYKQTKRKGFQT